MFTTPVLLAEDQSKNTFMPVPEDPIGDVTDDCRLWIGNLDTRVTEYTLLKLLQKFGPLRRFDFLINKQGPDKGKPRGYCFVSYENRENAELARKNLNGKLALSKRLAVRWAHADSQREQNEHKGSPADSGSISSESNDSKIRAIEAKLKSMEDSSQDFTISTKPAAPPGSSSLCQNSKQQQQSKKPYFRKK